MITSTHTRYWSEDQPEVRALRKALDELAADARGRRRAMDDRQRDAVDHRLAVLEAGYNLLLERAD